MKNIEKMKRRLMYRARMTVNGVRKSKSFSTKAAAEAQLSIWKAEAMDVVSSEELAELILCRKKLKGIATLTEAVDFFLAHATTTQAPTIAEGVVQFCEWLETSGRKFFHLLKQIRSRILSPAPRCVPHCFVQAGTNKRRIGNPHLAWLIDTVDFSSFGRNLSTCGSPFRDRPTKLNFRADKNLPEHGSHLTALGFAFRGANPPSVGLSKCPPWICVCSRAFRRRGSKFGRMPKRNLHCGFWRKIIRGV